jgi:ribosomal protein S1
MHNNLNREEFNVFAEPQPVKTISNKHKVFCNEPYAQQLYDMIVGMEHVVVPEENNLYKGILVGKVSDDKGRTDLIIDIGAKDNVYVPMRGLELKTAQSYPELYTGMAMDVTVSNLPTKSTPFTSGSISAAVNMKILESVSEISENNTPISATVTDVLPNGYMLLGDIEGHTVTMFMPNLQAGVNKLADASSLHNEKITVVVDNYDSVRNVYNVSRKRYLESLIPDEIEKLESGVLYDGTVTGTTHFGVFVEFNDCLTGMIHKSNLLPEYADRISEIVPGMPVQFFVKDIGKGNKLILTQVLRESLWDTIKVGNRLSGEVIDVKDIQEFGVLLQLDEETRGLIHTSELNNYDIKVGDTMNVKVIAVSKAERRIYLTPIK